MKGLPLILIFSMFFFACVPEDHVLEIEIVNHTDEPVQSIRLSTAKDRLSFEADNLPPGQEIGHTLQVKESVADGEYIFRFIRSNGQQESVSGSYLEEEEGAVKRTLIFNVQEKSVNVEHRVLEVE
ncbi:hypothetical protein [Salinimicrobium oceani]|uniref:Lipoprotein n=1 Tax=Salinimicrobium oceani TaxID=2722702 RepID=A0ABX1CYH0_9FLAO|nr:hypothetical protein [Salinimicrobium oceani]NJW52837.1 hypothetical protein [Salinimicrobium oceani]